jgi:membrane protein implicated in regulation of membrane protease activity
MIQLINTLANLVLLVFCLWAVLNKHLETQVLGTSALSLVAIASFVNIMRPDAFGFWSEQFEGVSNVAVAILAAWFWRRWHQCNCLGKR